MLLCCCLILCCWGRIVFWTPPCFSITLIQPADVTPAMRRTSLFSFSAHPLALALFFPSFPLRPPPSPSWPGPQGVITLGTKFLQFYFPVCIGMYRCVCVCVCESLVRVCACVSAYSCVWCVCMSVCVCV